MTGIACQIRAKISNKIEKNNAQLQVVVNCNCALECKSNPPTRKGWIILKSQGRGFLRKRFQGCCVVDDL